MRKLKISFAVILAELSLLWFQADDHGVLPTGFIEIRDSAIQYLGLLAFWMMSLSVVLAARFHVIEMLVGGLDSVPTRPERPLRLGRDAPSARRTIDRRADPRIGARTARSGNLVPRSRRFR